MYPYLSMQRENWLGIPTLYIKYKKDKKQHVNYAHSKRKKKEMKEQRMQKTDDGPRLKENLHPPQNRMILLGNMLKFLTFLKIYEFDEGRL